MRTTIKRQLLFPFAGGLALLAIAIGIGSVLAARGAANDELKSRTERAQRMARDTIERSRERIASDAPFVGQSLQPRAGSKMGLENAIVRLSIDRELSHLSLATAQGAILGADGRPGWSRMPLARTLERRAVRTGRVASATGVSPRGEPLILAAAPLRGGRARTVLIGRAIDRSLLASVERSLGVLLQVNAHAPGRPMPAERGELQREGTRTYTRPLEISQPGAGATLAASTSSRRLSAATWSILMVTGGAGVLVLIALLGFLQALLGRSVVSPVRRLAGGFERVRDGEHSTRVSVDGAQELRSLAEGFNEMTATVAEQHRRLEHLAATDHLTGLANHRRFHDALTRSLALAEREGHPLALVALDLDHFKALNDTHGHAYGDQALRAAATKLRERVRDGDLVGRVGGEEFAILLPAAGVDEAMAVAERARTAVEEVAVEDGHLGCSAGVAVFPDDTVTGPELLAYADAALYSAKRAGRGRTERFDARHVTTLSPRQQRKAVEDLLARPERISIVFQPIVSLTDRTIVGFEALARFDHESGRTPDEWFTMARLCGLGVELQALTAALALAVPARPAGTYLSVNLDPSALGTPQLEAVLPRDMNGIVIEITEQELISDHHHLATELTALRHRGARIALDDTGAGYAGLRHVTLMRPDVIKLDRALVEGLHQDAGKLALLESFATFAHRTGVQICAEGIELEEELRALAELGVDLGQGYLLCRPGPGWPQLQPGVAERLRDNVEHDSVGTVS